MKRVFVQTSVFSKNLDSTESLYLLNTIEEEILDNPEAGKIIAGLGGVRKLRIKDVSRGKGKRSGLRVLYLDLPHREVTYLIYMYGKDEAEDITKNEKKQILTLVNIIKGT
jgi:hypothetical protein